MSADHAERLRNFARLTCAGFVDDAADEIDRLTKEVAKLTKSLKQIENVADDIAQTKNTGLMNEVLEIARAALKKTTAASAAVRAEHDRLMNDPRTRRLRQGE